MHVSCELQKPSSNNLHPGFCKYNHIFYWGLFEFKGQIQTYQQNSCKWWKGDVKKELLVHPANDFAVSNISVRNKILEPAKQLRKIWRCWWVQGHIKSSFLTLFFVSVCRLQSCSTAIYCIRRRNPGFQNIKTLEIVPPLIGEQHSTALELLL